jgi:hypothetical protein
LAAVPKRGRPKSVRSEIERRASSAIKLAELEAQKIAVGELVLEGIENLIAMMRGAGFKMDRTSRTSVAATSFASAAPLPVMAAPALVQRPCEFCGKESVTQRRLPNGVMQPLCELHRRAEGAEMAKDALSAALVGPTAPIVARQAAPSGPKTVIHPLATDAERAMAALGGTNGPAAIIEDTE